MSFSQAGEQDAILDWAADRRGSFVDLGSYDGEEYSNTAALADAGWPGICVDAAPDAALACATRYADRADIQVVHAVFALDDCDPVTVHWSPGWMYTGTEASARTDIGDVLEITVPRLDLDRFAEQIRKLPQPLFCSIDLEGSSLDALGWLLQHTEAACVCVEANNPDDRATAKALCGDWAELPLRDNHVNLLFSR